MPLFDAHCHLQDERLAADLPAVMRRAAAAGVRGLLCCGCCEANWPEVLRIADAYPAVMPALGLHPWYLDGRSGRWPDRLEASLAPRPGAVGEAGLDHAVEPRRDEEQEAVLVAQLRIARRLRRPVSLHCRKAWGRLLAILRAEAGPGLAGMIHAYSGPAELVRPLEDLGWYCSFGGSVTRRANRRGRLALAAVSPERLLIETDSPDLPPEGAPGPVNEPANLALVAAGVAAILGRTSEWVAQQTYANACRLLGVEKS